MHIVLCSSSFMGGGITSYAHEVINCFSENNKVSVILGNDNKSPINLNNNVIVYYYDMDNCSLENARKTIDLINNELKPDVIINSNAKLLSLITPYIKDNIKIISISHSLKYIESDIAAINNKYIDQIIALSNFNKKNIKRKFLVNQEKIQVIYNFVNEIDSSNELRNNKINNNPITIVFAGGSAPSKSPEISYKIIKELSKTKLNFKFYWLGPLTPPLKKIQLFNSIKDIVNKDSRIIFTGRVPREEAINYINNANIFLIPSKREGCPIALLEALRIGTIAITSDYNNACKELIENQKNGFVISHKKINCFVDLIKNIIENHSMYHKYYEESYNYYKSELCYNRWKANMDQIIYDKGNKHKTRKNHFSVTDYKLRRLIFNIIKFTNTIEINVCEIIPSALRFFMYNFKK